MKTDQNNPFPGTEFNLASVKNKSMPYTTKIHSWTVSLIHRLLLGKIPKHLLIIMCKDNGRYGE